jgi:hypothetical protein
MMSLLQPHLSRSSEDFLLVGTHRFRVCLEIGPGAYSASNRSTRSIKILFLGSKAVAGA